MAITQADIDEIEAVYLEVLKRGAHTVKVNGKEVTYTDPDKLLKNLNNMKAELLSDTHGASLPVIFKAVS